MPRTKAVSAVLGRKSGSFTSNRYAAFAKDAHAGSPPWRNEAIEVPLAEFVRDPSKRQIRRIKDHMKAKHVKFASCHDNCQCSEGNREEFPELPPPGIPVCVASPGVDPPPSGGQAAASSGRSTVAKTSPGDNPPVSGGQATGKLHTFVKPQPARFNAVGKSSPAEEQATGKSHAFVKTGHGRWNRLDQGGVKTVRILEPAVVDRDDADEVLEYESDSDWSPADEFEGLDDIEASPPVLYAQPDASVNVPRSIPCQKPLGNITTHADFAATGNSQSSDDAQSPQPSTPTEATNW